MAGMSITTALNGMDKSKGFWKLLFGLMLAVTGFTDLVWSWIVYVWLPKGGVAGIAKTLVGYTGVMNGLYGLTIYNWFYIIFGGLIGVGLTVFGVMLFLKGSQEFMKSPFGKKFA